MKTLNKSGIKVTFIINKDRPRENELPNIAKENLIDHLRSRRFNNLVRENGNNIFEVDLIYGVEGRTNEIFRYIYNDLTHNNIFDNNAMNQINNSKIKIYLLICIIILIYFLEFLQRRI